MIRVYSTIHTWFNIRISQEKTTAMVQTVSLRQGCEHCCLQSELKPSLENFISKLKVKIKKKRHVL